MIPLGCRAKDKITGFTGTVTSRHIHITGCDRYSLQPDVTPDGKLPDVIYFDETRLDVTDATVCFVDPSREKVNLQPPG